MTWYSATGEYRQEMHANIDAESSEEAATKAAGLFQKWIDDGMTETEGVTFGPEDAHLDEEILVTAAKDATRESPTYWEDTEEVSITQNDDGSWNVFK